MNRPKPSLHFLFICFLSFAAALPLSAQTTFTWNQSGFRDDWDRDENWTPDPGSGGPNGADLAAIFDTTSAFTFVSLDEDITVGSITFDDARDYTIERSSGGNDLTFDVTTGSAAININNTNGDGAHLIDAEIILADDLVVTHNSTALFTLEKNISGAQAFTKAGTGTTVLAANNSYSGGTTISAGTLQIGDGGNTGSITGNVTNLGTLAFNRANNLTYSGVISGTGGVTQNGTGSLALTGTNTFTGPTTINAGSFILQSADQLADSTVVINTTNGLDLNSFGATLGGLSGTGNQALGSNSLTIGGNDDSTTYSGILSGTGELTKLGSGTLTLTGDNTYSGGTSIDSGTLQLGSGGTSGSITGDITNNATLTFNRSDNITYSSVISGTGNLIKAGTGDLELRGENTYSGTTTVSTGQLSIGDNNIHDALANSAVTVNAGATLRLRDKDKGDQFVIGSLAGAGTFSSRGAGAEIGGNNTSTTFSGSLVTDDITEETMFEKVGAGTWTLTGSGHSLHQLEVSAGDLVLNGVSGTVQILKADSSGKLTIQDTNALSLQDIDIFGDGFTSGVGMVLITGSSTDLNIQSRIRNDNELMIADGARVTTTELRQNTGDTTVVDEAELILGEFGNLLSRRRGTIAISDASGGTALTVGDSTNSTFEGVIEDHSTGPGSVRKTGSGTVTLTEANTYSGTTTIEEGVLRIGDELTLLNTTVSIGVDNGLDINGLDATLGGLEGNGDLDLGSTLLTIGNNNSDTTYSGIISGTGNVIKIGTGTLTLAEQNTYSSTTISTGTLQIGDGGTTGSITGDVTTDGILAFDRSDNFTFSGTISGTGGVTQAGSGTLILTGANIYTGDTTISAGTLQIGDGGTTASITGNIVNNGALVFDRSNDFTYSGVISGTGGLTNSGSGALTLSGSNTHTGTTSIDGSSIRIGTPFALEDSTVAINVDDGLDLNNSVAFLGGLSGSGNLDIGINNTLSVGFNNESTTYSGVLSGTGGTLSKSGTGTLTLTGDNTFVGLIEVGGTLQLGNGGTTGSISGLFAVVDGGALAFNRSDNVTFASDISGTGGVTQNGSGSLSLTGDNTFTGPVTLNAGSFILGSADQLADSTVAINTTNGLDLNGFDPTLGGLSGTGNQALGSNSLTVGGNNASTTYSGVLSGTGGVTKGGTGTLIFAGANTYSGATTINSGALELTSGSRNALQNSAVTLGADAVLAFDQADDNAFYRFGSLSGAGFIDLETQILVVGADDGDTVFSGSIIDNIGGPTGELHKTGSGTFTLSEADLLVDTVDVKGGSLVVDNATGLIRVIDVTGAGANVTFKNITAGLDPRSLRTNATALATITGGSTAADFSSLIDNSGTLIIEDGAQVITSDFAHRAGGATTVDRASLSIEEFFGGSTGTIAITDPSGGTALAVGTSSGTSTFAGTIVDHTEGPGSLAKTGDSTVILTGANTYTGGTTISGGTLRIGNELTLQNTTVSLGVNNGLDINGLDATLGGLQGSGNLALGSTSLTVGGNDEDTTYSGRLTGGAGELTKTGFGTLILTGNNTFNGGTTITSGTLQVGDGGTAGTIRDVVNNGTLVFDRSNDYSFSYDISGTGNLIKTGDGKLSLNEQTTYSGTTTVSAGELSISSGNPNGLANSAVTVESGATLKFDGAFSDTFVGSLAGAGQIDLGANDVTVGGNNEDTTFAGSLREGVFGASLAKQGTGTMTLTGSGHDLSELYATEGKLVLDGTGDGISQVIVELTGELTIQNTGSDFDLPRLTNSGTTLITGASTEVDIQFELTNQDTLTIADGASVATNMLSQNNGDATIVDEASLTIGRFSSSDTQRRGTIAISDASGGNPALTVGNSDNSTFEGVIEDYSTGPGSVLKTGSSIVSLNNANTYSGGTTIEAGVLRIGDELTLQNTTVSIGVDNGLDINDLDAILGGFEGSGDLNLGATKLTIGGNHATTTYSGSIIGTGSLTKRDSVN